MFSNFIVKRVYFLMLQTRVLVTHGITYLPNVDMIVVLKDGEVTEMGTYKQLLEKKGAFAEFLVHHLQEVGVDDGASEAGKVDKYLFIKVNENTGIALTDVTVP
jgi:ATP-binding cassette subfamily C (CFTR/MRP) protein 1